MEKKGLIHELNPIGKRRSPMFFDFKGTFRLFLYKSGPGRWQALLTHVLFHNKGRRFGHRPSTPPRCA